MHLNTLNLYCFCQIIIIYFHGTSFGILHRICFNIPVCMLFATFIIFCKKR